jgi:hypothetical protein
MVHVVATLGRAPLRIGLQKLDIEPIETAGRADVERAFADLLDGRDTGQRQEEAEVIGKLGVSAGDCLAARQILGLERLAIGCESKFRPGPGRRRAGLQRDKSLGDLAGRGNGDVDIAGLKDATQIGLVGLAFAQTLKRRLLVSEGLKEGNGNSAPSKGCSTRAEMASSISTAFISP